MFLPVSRQVSHGPARHRGRHHAKEDEHRRAELLAIAEAAVKRAELSDAAKDLFLANLSHELRSPLTSILLYAKALQEGRLAADAIVHAGVTIEANIRRQVSLVEDLIDVSRIAPASSRSRSAEVDLRALVAEVLESMRPEAEAKSLQIVVEGGRGPSFCQGDRSRLQQVVSNFLSNALKFTSSGGRVNVRVDAPDGEVRLVVSDTGRGIDPGSFLTCSSGSRRSQGPQEPRARPRPLARPRAGPAARRNGACGKPGTWTGVHVHDLAAGGGGLLIGGPSTLRCGGGTRRRRVRTGPDVPDAC